MARRHPTPTKRKQVLEFPVERTALPKAPTGIEGLDAITDGGLPQGRPTLVCGTAGCGKTLFAIEFLVRGAVEFDEPGVFMAFEETVEDLTENVRSLGFDLEKLGEENKVLVEYVRVEPSEIEETGEYDLEGLFIRLGLAIDSIGARRVVLDTLETLFGGLENAAILRAELRRLFRWLKDRGVTTIITAERGEGQLTRHGMEEYVSDCVILLDHRVNEQQSTRRLRVVKYRGSHHGTNEYPFIIDQDGISVLPITSLALQHKASTERISSGVPALDEMLGGGYYRGSSIMVTGNAGTGKTSLAAHFASAACKRGERCLYFAFEESEAQLTRNMRSIGIDLAPALKSGNLMVHASRPSLHGLEAHLVTVNKLVSRFKPTVVVIDPFSSFISSGTAGDVSSMLLRLVDFLKSSAITGVFTSQTDATSGGESTAVDVSSIIDTWIMVRDLETNGERNRGINILKSRGMAHSNQFREFILTSKGIELREPYSGPEGMLIGSARVAQEARDRETALLRNQDVEQRKRELDRKKAILDAQILALREESEALSDEAGMVTRQTDARQAMNDEDRRAMTRRRTSLSR